MGLNEIQHLDDNRITPFDVLEQLDQTITIYRAALAESLHQLTCDAIMGGESYLTLAGHLLYEARESLVASIEVPS